MLKILIGQHFYVRRGRLGKLGFIINLTIALGIDTRWRSCLRHCATSRKVVGSIPDGIIAIFH